jgi:ethanolamine phosphate transferase 2 subunit G
MIPKQVEMDGIVQRIFQAIATKDALKDALLVLCGDHGMNEGGNHGGSAPGETSPALVFISPKIKHISPGVGSPAQPWGEYEFYSKIEQSDIAPTLAGLLGFPIPLNNLGVFIPEFLDFWEHRTSNIKILRDLTDCRSASDKVQILYRNALQILDIVKATFPGVDFESNYDHRLCFKTASSGEELSCKWRYASQMFRDVPEGYGPSVEDALPALLQVRYHSCLHPNG